MTDQQIKPDPTRLLAAVESTTDALSELIAAATAYGHAEEAFPTHPRPHDGYPAGRAYGAISLAIEGALRSSSDLGVETVQRTLRGLLDGDRGVTGRARAFRAEVSA
jgi:hypothetical protein